MTVNGKAYADCVSELRKMRPPESEKGETGFFYYKIEAFTEAMDMVFGNEHYRFRFSEPYYRLLRSGQEMISVRCTLEIIGDDGTVVKSIDGYGDREILYANQSGRADVGNITSATATFAFKDACKYLGIFGYRTNDSLKSRKPGQSSKKSTKAKEENLNLIVSDMFYQQGESKGKPIWKLPVILKADGKAAEVVFYHNQTSKKAERFNELFNFVENGLSKKQGTVTLKLSVSPSGEYNGIPQYVFKDFV